VTVPLLADPTLTVIQAYGTAMEGKDIAVPSTFIVGTDRTILWKYIGETMADRPSEEEILQMAARAEQP